MGLSGRQTKRCRLQTTPALLAGLGTLVAMLALLEHHDLRELIKRTTHVPSLASA